MPLIPANCWPFQARVLALRQQLYVDTPWIIFLNDVEAFHRNSANGTTQTNLCNSANGTIQTNLGNSANGATHTSEGRSPSYKPHKYQRAEGQTHNRL